MTLIHVFGANEQRGTRRRPGSRLAPVFWGMKRALKRTLKRVLKQVLFTPVAMEVGCYRVPSAVSQEDGTQSKLADEESEFAFLPQTDKT